MEASDVTLIRGDLRGVVTAIQLSRRTMGTIKLNLFWAFVYNVIGIPVAAGALYPWLHVLLSPVFARDRKSTRLNSSHLVISYAVFCLKKKKQVVYTWS